MADNVDITPGTGATVAADEIGGAKFQRVKLIHGADGTNDGDVASGNPLPVTDAGGAVESGGNLDTIAGDTTSIDGKITACDTTGLATAAKQGIAGTDLVGGAGAVAAGVQRITLASDDPAVAALGTIDADTGNIAGDTSTIAGDTTSIDGKLPALGAAAKAAAVPVTMATDQPDIKITLDSETVTEASAADIKTAVQLIDDPVIVDDAAFTPATSKVNMVGFEADESSTDSVDEGDAGAARMTLDRKQIVTLQPHTTGGTSIFRSIDLDETEEDVKTSAGQVYGWYMQNKNAATIFVKFYNATAANTTVGTTTPVMTIPLPTGAAANVAFPNGIAFDTAICVAATTGVADNDTGAPAANDCIVNIFYK